MRPYSQYLHKIKSERRQVEVDLSGTTPSTSFAKQILDFSSVSIDISEHRNSPNYSSLKNKLSARSGFSSESIELYPGSSQAIFQIFAGLTKTGDSIVIETPTYTPILDIAKFLGLKILRFQRTNDFSKDFVALKKNLAKAKLAFITNPHAPSGRVWNSEEIHQLDKLKKPIIVDEIYLPHFHAEKLTLISAKTKNLISISGFSKSTGISGIRLSWAMGPKSILEKSNLMGLNLTIDLPTPSLVLGNQIIDKWDEILKSIHEVIESNRKTLLSYQSTLGPYFSHDFKSGNYGMLKIPKIMKTEKQFLDFLKKESLYLKPGSEFGMKNHFRFNLMMPPESFKKALAKIAKAY